LPAVASMVVIHSGSHDRPEVTAGELVTAPCSCSLCRRFFLLLLLATTHFIGFGCVIINGEVRSATFEEKPAAA